MKRIESIFDPNAQQNSVDTKIVAALERLSQVYRTLLWEKAKESPLGLTLSPIQIQFLVYLRFQRVTDARVGRLAREFDLTPATVSDSVRVLEEKGLVVKDRSPEDGRIQILRLTPEGEQAADEVGDWASVLTKHLHSHSDAEKLIVMRFLLDLIDSLHRTGLISAARMCSTCRYFGRNGSGDPASSHFCKLMDRPLRAEELRIDCPEHEPAEW